MSSAAAEKTPQQWLGQMNRAFQELDYDGLFNYYGGSELATIRVVHLVIDGVQHERLVHMNGAPREIVRVGDKVSCILQPGDEILELGDSIPDGPFARGFARPFEAIDDVYRLSMRGTDRVAGRDAVRIAIEPIDADRYGYRLWLDAQTALLLRSELRDANGAKLEIFQFALLEIGPDIPRAALEPETRDGSIASQLALEHPATVRHKSSMAWHARWVPAGFAMANADVRRTPSSLKAVNNMMYSDGIASFSVYIESMPQSGAGNLASRTGATVVVTHLAPGPEDEEHLVTVVGEVPMATARRIARSIYYRP